MTPGLWVTLALGVGVLAVLYRGVDGLLKSKSRAEKASRVKSNLSVRVEALEMELSRIPKHAASAERVDEVESIIHTALKTLVSRDAAEKILNQINAVTLDVVALKEWQQSIEQSSSLEDALVQSVDRREKS